MPQKPGNGVRVTGDRDSNSLRIANLLPISGKTQEGCGGLGGENPGVFPKAGPIFKQPFSLSESAQTLAGIAFRAAGKTEGKKFPTVSKFARNPSSKEFRPQPFRAFPTIGNTKDHIFSGHVSAAP